MKLTANLARCATYLKHCSDRTPTDEAAREIPGVCRILATAIRAAAIFGGQWMVWTFAGLFDVDYRVSALFVPAAYTVVVPMLVGARWLPWLYICLQSVALLNTPGLTFAAIDHLGGIRHIVLYGGMGLYLRRVWFRSSRRFSLETATYFIAVAFIVSLAGTILTKFTHTYAPLPPEQSGLRFLAIWGGDFSGVMVGVPLLLLSLRSTIRLVCRDSTPIEPTVQRADALPIFGYGLLACAVASFTAWLPSALGVNQPIAILMFFPIVLAGLSHGAIVGFAIAALSCAAYLLVGRHLGIPHGPPIEIQLIFAVSAGLALLSGAAHDDRLHAWRMANFDSLTGLPNRRLLADRIDQAWMRVQRSRLRMAILYIDLDGFKAVNDTHGHDVGDRLLIEASRRIRQCLRSYDTGARLGGDEFVVVISDLVEMSVVDRVAERILRSLAQPFELGKPGIAISGSIGIAAFPEDGDEPELLQRRADQALYVAKRAGRNCYRRYSQLHGS